MRKEWIIFSIVGLVVLSGTGIVTAVTQDYDLLILTPDDLVDTFVPLLAHKQQHGVSAKIVSLTEVYSGTYFSAMGRDPAETLKYFIKDAVEQWKVSYVMLDGATGGLLIDVTQLSMPGPLAPAP